MTRAAPFSAFLLLPFAFLLLPSKRRAVPSSVHQRARARLYEDCFRRAPHAPRHGLRLPLFQGAAANLVPLLARDAQEGRDHPRVELPPAERLQLRGGRVVVAAEP